MTKDPLDDLDRKLLRVLQKKGRAPVSELARELDVPRTTIAHRLETLEESKVIRRHTVDLDFQALGLGQTAFVMIQIGPNPIRLSPTLAKKFAHVEGVEEVHAIAGEWDLIVKIRSHSVKVLFSTLDKITKEPGVLRTMTLVCFQTYLENGEPQQSVDEQGGSWLASSGKFDPTRARRRGPR